MRGLMMGRFQPFHLGHLDLVRQILAECNEAIIAITSSQFNYLLKDPFTAGERMEMVQGSLRESGIDMAKCFVTAVENQFNIATWAAYLEAALPKFDRVYSGNEYVAMLLADSGYNVVRPNFYDRDRYNGTKIRQLMIKGEGWEEFVPKAVARIVKEVNGIKRLQTIAKSDTIPTQH